MGLSRRGRPVTVNLKAMTHEERLAYDRMMKARWVKDHYAHYLRTCRNWYAKNHPRVIT